MKYFKFLLIGLVFGVILTKSEVISWYRIYEMFRFESFHMYGVIGSALVLGIVFLQLYKWLEVKRGDGTQVKIKKFEMSVPRYLFGGVIFGLGWALTGACPGPLYVLVGNGFVVFLVPILSALAGTLVYGLVRKYLPH